MLESIIRRVVREELQAASHSDRLLTAEQVAVKLGYSDVRSVYRLRREKKLQAVNLGENSLRFRLSEINRFIDGLCANQSKCSPASRA